MTNHLAPKELPRPPITADLNGKVFFDHGEPYETRYECDGHTGRTIREVTSKVTGSDDMWWVYNIAGQLGPKILAQKENIFRNVMENLNVLDSSPVEQPDRGERFRTRKDGEEIWWLPVKEHETALAELKAEVERITNSFLNLQHIIVSKHGAESAENCVKEIRKAEEVIGPLGPINDFRLAQILAANLVLPYEIIIATHRKEVTRLREALEKCSNVYCENSDPHTKLVTMQNICAFAIVHPPPWIQQRRRMELSRNLIVTENPSKFY